MALNYDVSEEQKLKIYYAQGLANEGKKSTVAIDKFRDSLELLKNKKSEDLYLSALYHLSWNEHIHRKYSDAIRDVNRIIEEGCT